MRHAHHVVFSFLCAVLFLLFASGAAFPNDAAMSGVGGAPRFLDGEHPTVRMVREWVRMDYYHNRHTVKATFWFRNEGEETTVRMGFPEHVYNTGDPDKSSFKWFRTWVNGKRVYAKRLRSGDDDDNPVAYWVKDVHFARGQMLFVNVYYGGHGSDTTEGDHGATYYFTGGNWRGKVDESFVLIVLHLPGAHVVSFTPSLRRKENRLSGRWKQWEAQGEVGVQSLPTIPGALLIEEPVELQKKISDSLDSLPYRDGELRHEKNPYKYLYMSVQKGDYSGEYAWGPAILKRKEGLFIRSDALQEFPGIKVSHVYRIRHMNCGYYPSSVEISASGGSGGSLTFNDGNTMDKVSKNGSYIPVRLRKAPFVKRIRNECLMYVPLEPVERFFGGFKLTVNDSTRRARIKFLKK